MANTEATEAQTSQSSQLADFIQKLNQSHISDMVDSVPYNAPVEEVIVQMRDLLRQDSGVTQERSATFETPESGEEARTLAELSKNYQKIILELLERFNKWRLSRQQLVQEFRTCANKLERNCLLSSVFRILMSTASLYGVILRRNETKSSWAISLMKYATEFSFASVFLEHTLSVSLHQEVKLLVFRDHILFWRIKKWFEQSGELNRAVQNFFPYGIDGNLVVMIHRHSSFSDVCSKIFISVIASNARNDVKLFTNKDFLDKAEMFSTSEAGKLWYHVIVMKSDPVYLECLHSNLPQDTKIPSSVVNKFEFYSNAPFLLGGLLNKIKLNIMSIYLSAFNIRDGGKTDESEELRVLARKTQRELESMEEILTLMKRNTMICERTS